MCDWDKFIADMLHLMSFGFIVAVDSFYFCSNINCQIIEGMSKVKYAEYCVILSAKLSNFSWYYSA